MRVGWLADEAPYLGGAELTQAELRAAAPSGVQIVDCRPGEIEDCDVYAVHNCLDYSLEDLRAATKKRAVKYWNDVGTWLPDDAREVLAEATSVCCSPLQRDYMGLPDAKLVPPPIDLSRFTKAAASVNGDRQGAVCVGSWRNFGKAPHRAAAWALSHNEPLDFYGDGELAPPGSQQASYASMPSLLARYERFVYLPSVVEPFGRAVAEAWAAGCELVVNDLVGAKWWVTENPAGLETAAEDFWRLLLG